MLDVHDLWVRYPGSPPLTAVRGVSLHIDPGEAVGLVGESGSGKSTVAKAIVGIAPVVRGRVTVAGEDVTAATRGPAAVARRRTVQYVFQDPTSSLNPRLTVGAALAEAAHLTGLRRGDLDREVRRLLTLVGLSASHTDRYPFELSGGQRQRVAIARALAVKPRVLLLDEVTSALDVSVQATILNLLKELRRELGLSYLAISHDLAVIRYLCDRVAVIELGTIKETAPTLALFSRPMHPYTASLVAAVPRLGDTRPTAARLAVTGDPPDPLHRPAGCSFHTRCPTGPNVHDDRTRCRYDEPALVPMAAQQSVACHFPLRRPADEIPSLLLDGA